jgi:hypothetical protein
MQLAPSGRSPITFVRVTCNSRITPEKRPSIPKSRRLSKILFVPATYEIQHLEIIPANALAEGYFADSIPSECLRARL